MLQNHLIPHLYGNKYGKNILHSTHPKFGIGGVFG
jgi:hypothetical protein